MPDHKCSLLIVDDERYILNILATLLQQDYDVVTTDTAEAARDIMSRQNIDLVLCDQRMPRMTGVELLEWVRATHPHTIRMLMSGYADLKDAVEAINRGQIFRYLVKPWQQEELLQTLRDASRTYLLKKSHEELLEQLRMLNVELERRVEQRTQELEEANLQLQQKNAMLERLALTDELTGLPNRRATEQILLAEVRRRLRYPNSLAVALIDADNFKDINTRYLYPGGDAVLVALAKTLVNSLRGVDSVGRVGGEEFLVVTPENDLEGAWIVAERMRQNVEQSKIEYQGREIVGVTVSIGVAVAEENVLATPDQLIHEAAVALGEAKALGRNRCIIRTIAAETAPASETA